MSEPIDAERMFLRHALSTIAYRGGKVLRHAPADFADLRVGPTSRTPIEILAHIGDLFDWAIQLAGGEHVWTESESRPWSQEVERFFDGLAQLDAVLASRSELGFSAEKLFQGPIADTLTHLGQIAYLRRLAESPVRGENYFKAEIVAGRVGEKQAPSKREFD